MIFKNRLDAALKLAKLLEKYADRKEVLILGLARGGVVLAAEISRLLHVPFDLVMTQKIGAPFNPELAIGAITETGKGYFNEELIQSLGISNDSLEVMISKEKREAERRLSLYRKNLPRPILKGKVVILVDDGIATGSTMMATILSVQSDGAKEVIVAVPVAPPDALEFLGAAADRMICLHRADEFMSVSQFYEEFFQVKDSEILSLIHGRKG